MGIPSEKVIRFQKPTLDEVYDTMKAHLLQFREIWLTRMSVGEKKTYIKNRIDKIAEKDILKSFDYIQNLPENHDDTDVMQLAKEIVSGCLSYTCQDDDLFGGFAMGVYANYVLEKAGEDNKE
jgi:hypothetical protein